jgi:hypothetical protein
LYSFSQRGLQTLYKPQAPQNLDSPLIMSLSSCDFRKNGCDRNHVLLNRVDEFLTYSLHFCQLPINSVQQTSIKMHWVIKGFVKIGAVNNIIFLRVLTRPRFLHQMSDFREIWCNRHLTLFSVCEFRENWCSEGRSFLKGVNEITFRPVSWNSITYWKQRTPL